MCRLPREVPPPRLLFPLLLLLILCNLLSLSGAADTITPVISLGDGDTLLSAGGSFRLGFFDSGGGKRYLGIWYEKITEQTVVWVANRETPLANSTGLLTLEKEGNLVLYNGDHRAVWSSSSSSPTSGVSNPVARLLDTGNLVVREASEDDDDPERFLWQSFDYPTDTLLPGMKLGWDLKRGLNRFLRSWKAPDDPSPGDHRFRMELRGLPQLLLTNQSGEVAYRSGPWNGVRLSGVPEMKSNDVFTFDFVSTGAEVYYAYELRRGVVSRLAVSPSGVLQRHVWLEDQLRWSLYWWAPKDQCDRFAECGAYGICDTNGSPVCGCLEGFRPRSRTEWELRDGSGGCEREAPLDCRKGDGFIGRSGVKLPEASRTVVNVGMGAEGCMEACRRNCSCTAFSVADVRNGSGCIMWAGDLIDLRQYTEDGQDLCVRVAASLVGNRPGLATGGDEAKKNGVAVIVSATVAVALLLLGSSGCYLWKKKAKHRGLGAAVHGVGREGGSFKGGGNTGDHDLELPLFDFGAMAAATDNFSDGNKLGEGGFGPVYRGELAEGHDIAVKRLSKRSAQGIDEFRNEVSLIAKLQHRNLVRLLGCCIHGEERILVYEYMHNKGLDSFIFDKTKSSLLSWQKRFNVILGIARGLLYLHQDSRFRIIHRDLKASNILLDGELNPKISDFGAARIFCGDREDGTNTSKIVGTYGYMSPEYAMDGVFSVKSDVFSFGVLVIEIISGRKNRGFYYDDSYLNLLLLAWRLWKEGTPLELLDETMGHSYSSPEVTRCIHVALLCVQERAEDRPTMSTVVLMLGGANPALAQPRQPGYSMGRSPMNTGSNPLEDFRTVNQVTVTMLEGR